MSHSQDTLLIQTGRNPAAYAGYVNPPLFRGSTILAESYESWEAAKQTGNPYGNYGRFGSPTIRAFEEAIAGLEGGYRCQVFPSGLSACTHTLMGVLGSGDHVLITDNVYGPTRSFADGMLSRLGVDVEYFDPLLGASIASLLRPQTRLVFLESPGSLSFEVCDVPAIAQAVHAAGSLLAIDNSWASPLFFKPFTRGADISIQAATKYILGHSDALLGTVTCNEHAWEALGKRLPLFGETAGPEDVNLALRGLRTLGVRLRQHQENGIALATALGDHPAVVRVLHPALQNDPGHALWKRDFLGASGLFAFVLDSESPQVLSCFFGALRHFGIGLSWGGFESLALPVGRPKRTASAWPHQGTLIRVHAGLEDGEELLADMLGALDSASARITRDRRDAA
ncbi:MAG: cystathionine beta-lyase [Candidatus Dactylopiibacterium carminicum]|uniref:Cystathionine beta-lyase n=1 Tax=Candidatus Dactylopiibacterium carminicum TaxID=857335 RepID=A0A272EZ58_9RHOO|nr:cystathionine beta-lyase [Candidatus Dactylopiibacterium carminicum]KAF7600521.1 cystathionine beta-lyase [Candidatus Dactylopiibacterium carminicum]PAS94910.1 MAG: cystathionine beta-lyase [Candidatus Dactylopiibacterium carminicum]PAT00527.1 MAG: cystathionine beta-lyase [Candidatus Dactylopiibacterium carminicum]